MPALYPTLAKIQRDQRRFQFIGAGEVETQRRVIDDRLHRLHPGESLRTALRLFGGRGAGGVAGDIILQLGALRVLRGLGCGQLCGAFGALFFERVIAARVKRDLSTRQVQDMIDDIVEQVALVADHHHHRRIAFEEIFQPQGRFKVEVV